MRKQNQMKLYYFFNASEEYVKYRGTERGCECLSILKEVMEDINNSPCYKNKPFTKKIIRNVYHNLFSDNRRNNNGLLWI